MDRPRLSDQDLIHERPLNERDRFGVVIKPQMNADEQDQKRGFVPLLVLFVDRPRSNQNLIHERPLNERYRFGVVIKPQMNADEQDQIRSFRAA